MNPDFIPSAEAVEAARGRILAMLRAGSMFPVQSRPTCEDWDELVWDIELGASEGSRFVAPEIFAEVFPDCGGYIPAAGASEVVDLIESAKLGKPHFRAQVELCLAYLGLQAGDAIPLSHELILLRERSDSCRRIVNAFKDFWGPGHPLKIHEERSQAFRITLYSWKQRHDIDVTGLVHRNLLTEDGLCAAPNKTSVLQLVTAALQGEEEFIRKAVLLEAAMADANP